MKTYSAIWTLLALASLLLITACQPVNPGAQTQSTHTAAIPTLPNVEPTHLASSTPTSAPQDGSPSLEPTHLASPTQTSAPQDGNPSLEPTHLAPPTQTSASQDGSANVELQTVLQPQGPVAVQNMQVLNSDAFGNVLQMEFVNTGDQDLNISIPCGQVFEPSGESQEQALMVIQSTEFRLPAGETHTESPYLACINSDKSIPSQASGYQIGTMADGDLRSLAECICSREMVNEADDFNNLTLQFAVWMVADGVSFTDMLTQSGDSGALNQFTGGETGQAASALTNTIVVPATDVIRSCNIAIP